VDGIYAQLGPRALWRALAAAPPLQKPGTLCHFTAYWAEVIKRKLFPGAGQTSVQGCLAGSGHFLRQALSFLDRANESLPVWLNPELFATEARRMSDGENRINVHFLGKVATLAYWSRLYDRVARARSDTESKSA